MLFKEFSEKMVTDTKHLYVLYIRQHKNIEKNT